MLTFGSGKQSLRVEITFNPHLVQPPTRWMFDSFLKHSHFVTIKSMLNNSGHGSTLQKLTLTRSASLEEIQLYLSIAFNLVFLTLGREKKGQFFFPIIFCQIFAAWDYVFLWPLTSTGEVSQLSKMLPTCKALWILTILVPCLWTWPSKICCLELDQLDVVF